MAELLFEISKYKGAEFSECGKFRYRLWRMWDEKLPRAMVIGLNPSTANSEKNDPTIDNLTTALKILGYGGVIMMNCWPFITSKPELLQIDDESNFQNGARMLQTAMVVDEIIFAWGNFKIIKERNRDKELIKMFPTAKCFGFNKNGSPMHPLSMMYKGTVKKPKLEKYV
jgi:hypothetical protein